MSSVNNVTINETGDDDYDLQSSNKSEEEQDLIYASSSSGIGYVDSKVQLTTNMYRSKLFDHNFDL